MTEESRRLSFTRDVRPMFTDTDVDHMRAMMDLSDRDSVFTHAGAIYSAVANGSMPPPASGELRWTPEMCGTFKDWMEQGGDP